MIIYEKARELAKLIAESNELDKLKKLEIEIQNDEKASIITKNYGKIYNEISMAIKDKDEMKIEMLKIQMQDSLKEIENYELTKKLFKAKDDFYSMVNTINEIISHGIVGDQDYCNNNGCSTCSNCN